MLGLEGVVGKGRERTVASRQPCSGELSYPSPNTAERLLGREGAEACPAGWKLASRQDMSGGVGLIGSAATLPRLGGRVRGGLYNE